jgi:hypothetical protein
MKRKQPANTEHKRQFVHYSNTLTLSHTYISNLGESELTAWLTQWWPVMRTSAGERNTHFRTGWAFFSVDPKFSMAVRECPVLNDSVALSLIHQLCNKVLSFLLYFGFSALHGALLLQMNSWRVRVTLCFEVGCL